MNPELLDLSMGNNHLSIRANDYGAQKAFELRQSREVSAQEAKDYEEFLLKREENWKWILCTFAGAGAAVIIAKTICHCINQSCK